MTPNQRRALTLFNQSSLDYFLKKKLVEYHIGSSYFKGMNEDEAIFAQLVLANPLTYLAEWGRETGKCMICNRPLTNEESIARGIGPECAAKIQGKIQ